MCRGIKVTLSKHNPATGVYYEQGKLEDAVATYKQALAMEPVFPEAYNNLGVLHYQNLEVERALDMHLKALRIRESLEGSQLEPGDLSQPYINLGAVYKALGDFQKAHECVEKARRLSLDVSGSGLPARRRSAALLLDKTA